MTVEERNDLYKIVNDATIEPSEPMNLVEIKAYVKGCEYAYNAFLDAIDTVYRETKND
ncbi:MAG: hypothetical protein NC124_19630 [Clostridium sp.]|nr:hypothetical protein [Clostridium sp.]